MSRIDISSSLRCDLNSVCQNDISSLTTNLNTNASAISNKVSVGVQQDNNAICTISSDVQGPRQESSRQEGISVANLLASSFLVETELLKY